MKIEMQLSDAATLKELGHRLGRRRINLRMTQAELARKSGLGKRTLERLEGGDTVQLLTLIRVLRSLGMMEALEHLVPEIGQSPLALLRSQGKQAKRVRASRNPKPKKPTAQNGIQNLVSEKTWTWGDETEGSEQ